jgi:hypothetical protein
MLPDTAYYFQPLSVGERSLAKGENNQFLNYLRLCIFFLEHLCQFPPPVVITEHE